MATTTASSRISSMITLYDMHTKYFHNALEGISDEDARERLNTKANHIAWITGSLVQQRYELAKELGADKKQTADELFKDNKGIQDNVVYPSLGQFKKDWDSVSPVLRDALVNVSDEKLDSTYTMPGMSIPFFEMVAFNIYREAYLIGQIALWRRLLGREAMKWM